MPTRKALVGLFFFYSAMATAQDKAAPDRVTVPLSNGSQPPMVRIHLITGSITVTAGSASQVVVEPSHHAPAASGGMPAGMHRLGDLPGDPKVHEDHNVVSIESTYYGPGGDLRVEVPANSSLELKTINGGHIEAAGVNGSIEAENINGLVALKNVSGSVIASSQNGSITVSLDRVTPDNPMSFTTLNGTIDVTIPADTKARLRLKTENGSVFTDFDVRMEAESGKTVSRGPAHSLNGTINGGGPEYRFESLNGSILIHKK